jgi:hypothetical protein
LAEALPQYQVVVPETDTDARREIVDADAAYGWVPPDMLPLAQKLRWLQNPDAGPRPGYFYQELIDHSLLQNGSEVFPKSRTEHNEWECHKYPEPDPLLSGSLHGVNKFLCIFGLIQGIPYPKCNNCAKQQQRQELFFA